MGDGSGSAHGDDGLCIGLDVGTSGVKAVLVTPDGRMLASAVAGYPLLTPKPGWTEQDPNAWWTASCRVLNELTAKARGPIEATGLPEGLPVVAGGGAQERRNRTAGPGTRSDRHLAGPGRLIMSDLTPPGQIHSVIDVQQMNIFSSISDCRDSGRIRRGASSGG